MTSLNKGYGFMDRITPEKMVDAFYAISKRLANRAPRTKVIGNTSMQAALVMLPSPDLEAMLNAFRSVAGQIETLLLEGQLVEVGFDAVKVCLDKPRIATR
ncbi:hypothetical protein ABC383_23120 [Noviherbaspirillum sp. 1P10PC]|uniref:hypothetical protein n=1 Tax=Noviherbaspirillum sp. 1P10PC TaxID=3132292 RepID=UPI0039A0F75C